MEDTPAVVAASSSWRSHAGRAFAVIAVAVASIAVLDPARRACWPAVLGLFAVAVLLGAPLDRRRWLLPAAVLGVALAGTTLVSPDYNSADSLSYYVYLHSLAFDRDLDFTNEFQHFGNDAPPRTATGLPGNAQSIGPAIVWSPFYLAAHLYVRALGTSEPADGYSQPYRRAVLLGSVTWAVLGCLLLVACLQRRYRRATAWLALLGVMASPILYYMYVVPGMAHAPAFAAACALIWALERTDPDPPVPAGRGAWLLVGTLLGLVTLMRWQAVVYGILVAAYAIKSLSAGRVRLQWLALAGVAAIVVFSPQLLAWKTLFGSYVTIPQGGGFMDWSSPHFMDCLVSADHGLFVWTPAMLALLALVFEIRRLPALAGGGLLVFFACAWVNGGVRDWAAGDAFGARRFDVIVPLAVVGLASALVRGAAAIAARPLLLPGACVALLAAWNVGFIGLFHARLYPRAVPLERLTADAAHHGRLALQEHTRTLLGDRAAAWVYKALVGEYLYVNLPAEPIALASADERLLAGNWSARKRRPGEPGFRWALPPRACVRLPLEAPFDLPIRVFAQSPWRPRTMSVVVNDHPVGAASVASAWEEMSFLIPEALLRPGENMVCLQYEGAAQSGNAAEPGLVAVSEIRLP